MVEEVREYQELFHKGTEPVSEHSYVITKTRVLASKIVGGGRWSPAFELWAQSTKGLAVCVYT